MTRRMTACLALGVALVLIAPARAHAQCPWSLLSGFGYGGAGVGASFLASHPGWPSLQTVILVTGGSMVGGYMTGSRACRANARGEELGGIHKIAVRLGTALAGGTTGAIVAGFITEGVGEPGSDEAILARSIAVGVAGGALLQYLLERSRPLRSNMTLGIDDRGASLMASIRF